MLLLVIYLMRYITATLAYLLYATSPQSASAAGIVPCGGTGQAQCQTCDLLVLSNNLLLYIFSLLAIIAGIVIVYAGIVMVTSRGDAGLIQQAKSFLTNIFIGLVIVFSAWFIVDTIGEYLLKTEVPWNVFQCVEQPEFKAGPLPKLSDTGQRIDIEPIPPDVCLDSSLSIEALKARGCRVEVCPPAIAGVPGACVDWCAKQSGDLRVEKGTFYCVLPPEVQPPFGGNCEVMTTGGCTVDKLSCFGSNAAAASQICSVESGGVGTSRSGTDLCKTGESFSYGLFQINVFAHYDKLGGGCTGGFFTKNGPGVQGTCLEKRTNSAGTSYCAIRDCAVTNKSVYNACVTAALDQANNIRVACQLYNARGKWTDWKTTAKICKLPR